MLRKAITSLILLPALCHAGKSTTDKDYSDKPKVQIVYRTNYVQVPVVCATLDVADYQLVGGHSYRLMVADGAKPWRPWGMLRPTTNTNARLWVPPASVRPLQWQLIDVTPGFPQQAVIKQAPDCISKPQWVVLGIGNVRPVR